MYDEHGLIDSPLNRTYMTDGRSVEIHIYRTPHTGWTLELVDDLNNSTVWDGEFATDQEALDTTTPRSTQKALKPSLQDLRTNPRTELGRARNHRLSAT